MGLNEQIKLFISRQKQSMKEPKLKAIAVVTPHPPTILRATDSLRLRRLLSEGPLQLVYEPQLRIPGITIKLPPPRTEMYKQIYLEDYGVSKVADLPDNAKVDLMKALSNYRSPKQSVAVEEGL
ncbi:hypothetical protein M011DRAFT_482446 [Sporormia fimetaria CBS 119925]|uniref:Uncharacterized protein n=1 Tax=Sporormia fimetaria CBS 119925 TaxID=1340428 RepID=A0A6A6UTK1_9PLEO|nr:hypothetical protein M011DRAFT_482446 [Sporormia fimetaria CBS 119925]